MPTDETLRRIREEWEKGHGLEDNDCQSELDDLQLRSYDAGYQAGIEAAIASVKEQAAQEEAEDGPCPLMSTRGALVRLDALKAVPRG